MRAESGRERRPRRDARVGEFLVGQAELGEERSAADVRADGVEVVGRCRGGALAADAMATTARGAEDARRDPPGGPRGEGRTRETRGGDTREREVRAARRDQRRALHAPRACPEVASARGASTTGHDKSSAQHGRGSRLRTATEKQKARIPNSARRHSRSRAARLHLLRVRRTRRHRGRHGDRDRRQRGCHRPRRRLRQGGIPHPRSRAPDRPQLVSRRRRRRAPSPGPRAPRGGLGPARERVRAHLLPPARMDRRRRGRRARHGAHPHQPRRSRPTHPDDVRVLQRRGLYIVDQPVAASTASANLRRERRRRLRRHGRRPGRRRRGGHPRRARRRGRFVRRLRRAAPRRDDAATLSDADVDAARDAVCVVAPARDGTRDGTQSAPPDTAFTLPDGNVLRCPARRGSACGARRSIPRGAAILRRARRGGGGVHAGPATGVSGRRARERVVGGGAGRRAGVGRARCEIWRMRCRPVRNQSPRGRRSTCRRAAMYPAWFGGRFSPRWCSQQQHVSKMEYQGERADGDDERTVTKRGWISTAPRRRSLRGNRRLGRGEGFETDRASSFVMYKWETLRGKTRARAHRRFWSAETAQPTHQRKEKIFRKRRRPPRRARTGRGDDNRGVDDDTRR